MEGVVELPAAPRARGEAHGEALRDLIAEGHARWKDSLATTTGRHPDEWIRDFLGATDFRPAVERWAPSFLAEVEGIAAGAGVDAEDVYAFQLVDEQWCFESSRKDVESSWARGTSARKDVEPRGCSTLGKPGLVAQNLDLPPWWDGLQAVLRIADGEEPGVTLVTAAGFLCMNGMSDAVAIGVNALPDVPSATTGLPVAFVIRQALLQPTAELAAGFIESVTHSSGQSYIVADHGDVIGIEADSDGTTRYGRQDDVVVHTNHAVVRASEERQAALAAAALANTTARLDALRAADLGDVDRITSALTCAPLLRQPTTELPGITFATVVFDVAERHALVRGTDGEPITVKRAA